MFDLMLEVQTTEKVWQAQIANRYTMSTHCQNQSLTLSCLNLAKFESPIHLSFFMPGSMTPSWNSNKPLIESTYRLAKIKVRNKDPNKKYSTTSNEFLNRMILWVQQTHILPHTPSFPLVLGNQEHTLDGYWFQQREHS